MNATRFMRIWMSVALTLAEAAALEPLQAVGASLVQDCIRDLGSEHYRVREEASKRLQAIGEEALQGLDKAARESKDPEVRRRASLIRERILGARQVASYQAHKFDVSSVMFSPDGGKILSASADGGVALFSLSGGAHQMLRNPEAEPTEERPVERRFWVSRLLHGCRAKFGSGTKEIFVADDGGISIIDPKDGRLLGLFNKSVGVYDFSVAKDREVTGYGAFTVQWWENDKAPARIEWVAGGISSFSADGTKVAFCLGERMVGKEPVFTLPPLLQKVPATITLYETRKLAKEVSFSAGSLDFRACALSTTGKILLTGHPDGCVRVWDTVKKKEVRRLENHSAGVRAIAISSDDAHAVTGDDKALLCFWELQTGKLLRTFQNESSAKSLQPEWLIQEGEPRGIWSVAISPNGELAASGSRDGAVRVWALPRRR